MCQDGEMFYCRGAIGSTCQRSGIAHTARHIRSNGITMSLRQRLQQHTTRRQGACHQSYQRIAYPPDRNRRMGVRSETVKVEMTHMMGTDLTVVNAARVSYGKHTETLRDQDVRLIAPCQTRALVAVCPPAGIIPHIGQYRGGAAVVPASGRVDGERNQPPLRYGRAGVRPAGRVAVGTGQGAIQARE